MSDLKSQEVRYGERLGSGGSDAILAEYFRTILFDFQIPSDKFQALLDRYIVNQGLASNSAEISTSRSALRRELMSKTMTWKVFIKGLKFLRIITVRMSMTLFRDGKKTTTHEYEFDVNADAERDDDGDTNVLARYFRNILMDLNVEEDEFDGYLEAYVKKYKPFSTSGVTMDELPKLMAARNTKKHTDKCSLRREILKDSISWKVFVKGLFFLKTNRLVFRLKLVHRNGMISRHEKVLNFG